MPFHPLPRPALLSLVVLATVAGVLSFTGPAQAAPPAIGGIASPTVPEIPIYAKEGNLPAGLQPVDDTPAPVVAHTVTNNGNGLVAQGGASTWIVAYDGGFDVNPAAKISFQAAVDTWASTLVSTVPIRVTAKFGTTSCGGATFPGGVLGAAGPAAGGVIRDFPDAVKSATWYPIALANAQTGVDQNPAGDDICAAFNSTFTNWYFGTSGLPTDKFDFESVVLHELGHGLGFVGSMALGATAGTGDCCFSQPDGNQFPIIFDTGARTGAGTSLLSLPHPSSQLLTALTSNDLWFRGPATNAVVGSATGAKLYAPNPFAPGSSFSHLDEATYGELSGNALMTPGVRPGEAEKEPGPITVAIFKDMGWGVAAAVPGAPTGATAVAGNASATVSWTAPADDGGAAITNYTVTSTPDGKTCTKAAPPLNCTVTGLTNGTTYTFTVRAQNSSGQGPASAASNAVVPVAPPAVPGAPLNPLATAGNGSATVTWAAPTSNGGAPITQYVVTSTPDGLTCTWTGGPLTCLVNGLTNGTPYRFSVTAKNSVGPGPASALSNQVSPGSVTPPGAPTAVVATEGKQQARVTWSAPASNGGSLIASYVVVANPGNQSCTWVGGPFTCTVTGLTAGTSTTFTVRATNDAGPGPASTASNAVVPWSGSFFHPLDPQRLLDSRTGAGFSGKVSSGIGNTKALTVTGGSVPASASAVVMNVTATGGTDNSFITVFPNGEPVPSASNLNFAGGETIPNLVTVKVGAQGKVAFFNAAGAVDVVADVVGYYDDGTVSGDRFNPLDPTRILDTRTGTGFSGKVGAGPANTKDLTVRGAGTPLPGTASAAVVNVTATGGTAGSFLSVFPSGSAVPTASNLNFAAGQTIPNLAVVKIGANGKISFFNAVGAVDVVVDVVGYFDPGGGAFFHVTSPTRILDSRSGLGGFNGPVSAGVPKALVVGGANNVPADATAAVMNTTVTGGTNASFLTLFPTGGSVPNASNLNFANGQTIPNLVTVKLGTLHRVSFANAVGAVHTIADLVGYYGPV